MTPAVRVGTSGFAYPEWRGRFYPKKLAAAKMLAYYAERFETVEINATFSRLPAPATLAAWAAAVPPAFLFTLKAPRWITHFRRLRDVEEPLRAFCDLARELGPRLGPLLFQLPPNFKKDPGRLHDLLARVPPDLRCAVEFRHPSWFAEEVFDALRARDAALCVADTEAGSTPDESTASWGYYRLRDTAWGEAELQGWATVIGRPGRHEVFCYFKHEDRGTGPALAGRLRAALRARVVP